MRTPHSLHTTHCTPHTLHRPLTAPLSLYRPPTAPPLLHPHALHTHLVHPTHTLQVPPAELEEKLHATQLMKQVHHSALSLKVAHAQRRHTGIHMHALPAYISLSLVCCLPLPTDACMPSRSLRRGMGGCALRAHTRHTHTHTTHTPTAPRTMHPTLARRHPWVQPRTTLKSGCIGW